MAAVNRPQGETVVLSVNCGSSSLKFGLFRVHGNDTSVLCEGEAQQLGTEHSSLMFRLGNQGLSHTDPARLSDASEAFRVSLERLKKADDVPLPRAVGHRIVHGGPHVRDHVRVNDSVIRDLQAAAAFAPLHVPAALKVVEEARRSLPETVQVACLDTAFHRNLPDVSRTLPLPLEIRSRGVERYGFHGLSIESIIRQMDHVPDRTIVAHLGGGCSVTAIKNGISIDTSMGLTPTGGIMMGTRPGDLDPGVLPYLGRSGYTPNADLENLLERRSGLLGISETTSDMRELWATRTTDPRADLALRMFAYSVRKGISAMAAALGGLDLLVFTGGIGEHALEWREEVVRDLAFLGAFELRIVPAREDETIALITARLSA